MITTQMEKSLLSFENKKFKKILYIMLNWDAGVKEPTPKFEQLCKVFTNYIKA